MKALVIAEPWIGMILRGEKSWEMRTRDTSFRGWFGLVRKGSGLVVGRARLVESFGPLNMDELAAHQQYHRVPMELYRDGTAAKWCYAWRLEDAQPLASPVPYHHAPGAVIWVKLDEAVAEKVWTASAPEPGWSDVPLRRVAAPQPKAQKGGVRPAPDGELPSSATSSDNLVVPVAKDGSWFGPHLQRAGGFTIGEKGEEIRIESYGAALQALSRMSPARWRRPNSAGNWGIVSAVAWRPLNEISSTPRHVPSRLLLKMSGS